LDANYRNDIKFTGSSESLTVSDRPTDSDVIQVPTPSNEAISPSPTSPGPAETLPAGSDTAGTSTMLEVTNVISAAPVPPGKAKSKGKGKAMATVVGAGFTEK
jgi:hypothetical protein